MGAGYIFRQSQVSMYIPKHFVVDNNQEALAFVEQNAFGTLTSLVNEKLFSTHLPFLVTSDRKRLMGHVARANPQWHEINDQEVLVTFLGEHAYVSPTWYSSPGVPTWNYQAVHIYGTARAVEDRKAIESVILGLTDVYEDRENPWKPEFKESLLTAIVAIEIEISEIQCKFKLSQNRSEEDQKNVAKELGQGGFMNLQRSMNNLRKP